MTTTFTAAGLRAIGFRGFERFTATKQDALPKAPGVYALLREKGAPPVFLEQTTAGPHQGADLTVPVEVLRANWVARTPVLYVGSGADLRERVDKLRRQAAGASANHSGGCYLWQLADAADLRLAWRETPDEDPRAVEKALLREFKAAFGVPPFANR